MWLYRACCSDSVLHSLEQSSGGLPEATSKWLSTEVSFHTHVKSSSKFPHPHCSTEPTCGKESAYRLLLPHCSSHSRGQDDHVKILFFPTQRNAQNTMLWSVSTYSYHFIPKDVWSLIAPLLWVPKPYLPHLSIIIIHNVEDMMALRIQ